MGKVSRYRTLYEPPMILASRPVTEKLRPLDDKTTRRRNRKLISALLFETNISWTKSQTYRSTKGRKSRPESDTSFTRVNDSI